MDRELAKTDFQRIDERRLCEFVSIICVYVIQSSHRSLTPSYHNSCDQRSCSFVLKYLLKYPSSN